MKYTEVIQLAKGRKQVLVIHPVSTPASSLAGLMRSHAVFGILADDKNYLETSWTGSNGDAWSFDPNHRGTPPLNRDPSSRAKRHLIRLTDSKGVLTGQQMLVMPKNIIGLYSEVEQVWQAEELAEQARQAEQARVRGLEESARAQGALEVGSAIDSVMRGMAVVLGRSPASHEVSHRLDNTLVWNDDRTAVTPKVTGSVIITYDLYLRLMESVYAGVDAG